MHVPTFPVRDEFTEYETKKELEQSIVDLAGEAGFTCVQDATGQWFDVAVEVHFYPVKE